MVWEWCLTLAGHRLVALANLHPPGPEEELDSFMFQTVGHGVVAAYGQCLDVPLVRRPLKGTAVAKGLAYQPHESVQDKANGVGTKEAEDEVEDLLHLLQDVLQAHTHVTAVSCGAILSDYQRYRVENVYVGIGCRVQVWLTHGLRMAYTWPTHGLHMAYTHGLHMAYTHGLHMLVDVSGLAWCH